MAGPPYYAEAHAVNTAGGVIWTGTSWPNDQVSEVTVQSYSDTTHDVFHIMVRVNAAGTAGYDAVIVKTTTTHVSITNYATGASLSSSVAVTVNPGDVWTLQAAGCCITLYQNGTPVCFIADATFPTGGSPGFAINSLTGGTLATAQIASWRGYNCVQQDGIWQKQGISLAPNATDLASSGQGLFGGTFIYDTNPQLIGGTNCYKTWFSGGTPASQGTYYAEAASLAGPWTRNAAQVISVYGRDDYQGRGNLLFILSGSKCRRVRQHCTPYKSRRRDMDIDKCKRACSRRRWHLGQCRFLSTPPYHCHQRNLVCANNGRTCFSGGQFEIGLATSTDGAGAVWTKYSGNPVLAPANTAVFPLQAWALVNGTYYFWLAVGPSAPQQASGQDIYQLPSETARYSTTDFIHWSGPVHSLHHSDQYESLNNPIGAAPNNPGSGLNPCAVFTVGNETYAIGQAEYLDGASAGTQFSLAIAPAKLSQIVLFNEDAVQQTQTDAFTSGAGNLDANWTNFATGWSALKIVSGNLCEPATFGGNNNGAVYTGAAFTPNQYAEVTITTLTDSTNYASPLVLGTVANGDAYGAYVRGATGSQAYQVQLQRFIGGTATAIGPKVGATINVGDVIRLSVLINAQGWPVLSLFQNGSMLIQYVDESSSALTTGNPGIFQFANTVEADSQISLFAAGNANIIPIYPPINGAVGWSPVDSRQAVFGFGPAANIGVTDEQGNVIYSAQEPPFLNNSQVSDNSAIPPTDCRIIKPIDSRTNIPVNSRVAPPFGGVGEP